MSKQHHDNNTPQVIHNYNTMLIIVLLFLLLCFIMTCTSYTSQYRSRSNETST